MKLKILVLVLIISVVVTIVTATLTQNSKAEENRAEIVFAGEPTYILKSVENKSNFIVYRYNISVKLQNIGNKRSDKLTVNLTDEEGFTLHASMSYIEPGETGEVVFEWVNALNRGQNIKVNFYPSSLDTATSKYNSGSTQFTIGIGNDDVAATSTPGFELIILVISIIVMIYLNKRRQR